MRVFSLSMLDEALDLSQAATVYFPKIRFHFGNEYPHAGNRFPRIRVFVFAAHACRLFQRHLEKSMNLDSSASASASVPRFQSVRRDQLRQEYEHDSYKRRYKPVEPSLCPDCGAIFHAGRWQWGSPSLAADKVICPACHRIRDHFPAGFLYIEGEFFASHRAEILNLIRHHAERERAEHALARIIAIQEGYEAGANEVCITTTDIHLARDLGEALHHAYQGQLNFHYNEAENLLRVHWQR